MYFITIKFLSLLLRSEFRATDVELGSICWRIRAEAMRIGKFWVRWKERRQGLRPRGRPRKGWGQETRQQRGQKTGQQIAILSLNWNSRKAPWGILLTCEHGLCLSSHFNPHSQPLHFRGHFKVGLPNSPLCWDQLSDTYWSTFHVLFQEILPAELFVFLLYFASLKWGKGEKILKKKREK